MRRRTVLLVGSIVTAFGVFPSWARAQGQWVAITNCPGPTNSPCAGSGWPWVEAIHAMLTNDGNNVGKVVLFKNSGNRASVIYGYNRAEYWNPVTTSTSYLTPTGYRTISSAVEPVPSAMAESS